MEKQSLPLALPDVRKAAYTIDKRDFNLLVGAVGGDVGGKVSTFKL